MTPAGYEAQLSSIMAKVEALQRDVARIEPAQQRNYDNVDMTRHAIANNVQKVLGELDDIKEHIRDLKGMFTDVGNKGKGALTMWNAVSPFIVAALGVLYAWEKMG